MLPITSKEYKAMVEDFLNRARHTNKMCTQFMSDAKEVFGTEKIKRYIPHCNLMVELITGEKWMYLEASSSHSNIVFQRVHGDYNMRKTSITPRAKN